MVNIYSQVDSIILHKTPNFQIAFFSNNEYIVFPFLIPFLIKNNQTIMLSIKKIIKGGQLQDVIKELEKRNITVQYVKKLGQKPYLKILYGDEYSISQLYTKDCIELKDNKKIFAININLLKKSQIFLPDSDTQLIQLGKDKQATHPYNFNNEKVKLPTYFSVLPPPIKETNTTNLTREKNEDEPINNLFEFIRVSPRR